ncbi:MULTISPECIES: ABC transporter ATP-binding protein [Prauserella salsuginis group]|uniref:ABC transporter ATP-binding protein n=1 Tax=Prauserella salsuginis TaxID=387889 RepID=A0ABW6G4B8_9PSEU|nr:MULTISPECIES: ABC transporter ATP-binding protein [Prauserella salsuginis group]MCR3718195.1 putative ABC transport system ATP-binding protein [Prauserella flava]MCR3732765.1 putative ABC transport system ATP-binding protein [Prauserella salsuginis]
MTATDLTAGSGSADGLRATGLRRSFPHPGGDVDVLRGVDVTVGAGELVTIAGRSGSGKSTLLALLSGFDTADAGSVLIAGEPVTADVPWQRCALLPQALGLVQELTAGENVALPLRLRHVPDSEVIATTTELLAALRLDGLSDRYPPELSFGQQQRVALARALAPHPTVLVADEPTAHLDAGTVPAVLSVLRAHADGGGAVLVATHDDAVHAIADRRLDLTGGVIARVPDTHGGTVAENVLR